MTTQLTEAQILQQCEDTVSKEPPVTKEGLVP